MESLKIHYKIVYKIFGRTNLHTQLIQKYHNRNPPPFPHSLGSPPLPSKKNGQNRTTVLRTVLTVSHAPLCSVTFLLFPPVGLILQYTCGHACVRCSFAANTVQVWRTPNNVFGRRIFDRHRSLPDHHRRLIHLSKPDLLFEISTSFLAWMANRRTDASSMARVWVRS